MYVKQYVGLNYYGTHISPDANDYFVSYFTYKGKMGHTLKNVDLWVSSEMKKSISLTDDLPFVLYTSLVSAAKIFDCLYWPWLSI